MTYNAKRDTITISKLRGEGVKIASNGKTQTELYGSYSVHLKEDNGHKCFVCGEKQLDNFQRYSRTMFSLESDESFFRKRIKELKETKIKELQEKINKLQEQIKNIDK